MRQSNIVSYTARLASGARLAVSSDLKLFGTAWFPARTEMTQQTAGGQLIEIVVEVIDAQFDVSLTPADFSWSRLGPPVDSPRQIVFDYRSGGQHGVWDGMAFRQPVRERPPAIR